MDQREERNGHAGRLRNYIASNARANIANCEKSVACEVTLGILPGRFDTRLPLMTEN